MGDPLARVPDNQRDLLRRGDPPSAPRAMLATLTSTCFSDPRWLYERKFDGERVLSVRRGGTLRLLSRNGKRLNNTYPELVEALERGRAHDLVADGEVVAFEHGRSSFARLQQRMGLSRAKEARASGITVYYYVFDLPHLDGHDLRRLPLRTRKRVLRALLDWDEPLLRFTPHRNTEGEAYLRSACERGWEGVIAKRADSAYRGDRSRDWLKFKCVNQQELVIGGFTPPRGSRTGFGALLVGHYARDADGNATDRLVYAGKVGTGYDERTLRSLTGRLEGIEIDHSPFDGRVDESAARWVRPELVAEIGFSEWTADGRLRHPRYHGLRRDKRARDVVRERPESSARGGRA